MSIPTKFNLVNTYRAAHPLNQDLTSVPMPVSLRFKEKENAKSTSVISQSISSQSNDIETSQHSLMDTKHLFDLLDQISQEKPALKEPKSQTPAAEPRPRVVAANMQIPTVARRDLEPASANLKVLTVNGTKILAPFPPDSNVDISGDYDEDRGDHKHGGTDFGAPAGTRILQPVAGKVDFVGYRGAYGNMVDVYVEGVGYLRYAHLKEASQLKVGDIVSPGTLIGLVGSTGRSTAPHLHFEVRREWQTVKDDDGKDINTKDPLAFLAALHEKRQAEIAKPIELNNVSSIKK